VYGRYGSAIPYPVYWVLAPIAVSALLIAVYQVAMATMPRVFEVMIGGGARARTSVSGAQRSNSDDPATVVKI
jgi:succinoglycan biosynthesis protein ExoH